MFERWLKRVPTPETLDLRRHRPEEFSGKVVTVEGRNYLIGDCIRQGDQGHAHRLVNQLSGLCQHVIQIRPEYMQAPETALSCSRTKAKVTADLRAQLLRDGQSETFAPVITVREANGGSFEMHEVLWGAVEVAGTPAPGMFGMSEAGTLSSRGDHAGAAARLEQVLREHPHHTVALDHLAACHLLLGDHEKASAVRRRAVEIEPNHVHYRGVMVADAINAPRRFAAGALFDELRARYPHVRDFDWYGVHAYLRVGNPGKAREVLDLGAIPAPEAQALHETVTAAERAHAAYLALENEKLTGSQDGPGIDEVIRVLEAALAAYPVAPYILANLGFTLRQAGEHERAGQLLMAAAGGIADRWVPFCWANAAYCLIAQARWPTAMTLLTMTMQGLASVPGRKVDPADIPGLVDWIYQAGMVRETITPSASELLDRAIADCPDQSLIGPEIRELAALSRKFRSQVKGTVRPV